MRKCSLPVYTQCRLQVTKASAEGHLLLVAPSHRGTLLREERLCAVEAGNAMRQVQSLLWQKMQPTLLQTPKKAQVVAGLNREMRVGQRETVIFSSLNNVWTSSSEDRALNLTESCRARATQSPWKGCLVQKGDSCPWPQSAHSL